MRPIVVAALLSVVRGVVESACDVPQSGCTNGLFSAEECACQCIEPFCPDANGDCTLPTSNCGGNPWAQCERGIDCPWWPNPRAVEECATGNVVPAGVWTIFHSRRECCESSYPFLSNYGNCDPALVTEAPTKHPTISKEDLVEDLYEIVPLRFDIRGLPDDVDMKVVRENMLKVLKRILLRLSEEIEGLKISKVEERASPRRLGEKSLADSFAQQGPKPLSLYYNVYVVRDPDGERFGPRIIREMRERYGEILDQIQTAPDLQFFHGAGVEVNFCAIDKGRFSDCVLGDDAPASAPSSVSVSVVNNRPTVDNPTIIYAAPGSGHGSAPTMVNVRSEGDDNGGLAGWAVFVIILLILILLCCIGACVFFCVRHRRKNGDKDEEAVVRNNFFFDERSRRSRASGRPRRSRAAVDDNANEVAIVLANPQDPKFSESSFSVDTYATSRKKPARIAREPTECLPVDENGPPVRGKRMYCLENGDEDPPMRVQREPTQYVDGRRQIYFDGEAPAKPQREPTMYIGGQSVDENASFATEEYASPEVLGQSCPAFHHEADVDRSARSGRSHASNVDRSGRSGRSGRSRDVSDIDPGRRYPHSESSEDSESSDDSSESSGSESSADSESCPTTEAGRSCLTMELPPSGHSESIITIEPPPRTDEGRSSSKPNKSQKSRTSRQPEGGSRRWATFAV